MREIAAGIWHWTARHEGIGQRVSSYYVQPAAALIDPMEPEEGVEWFAGRECSPARVLLTNRHHLRHSARFRERFGCEVLCSKPGLHEFDDDEGVRGFSFGEMVAPHITALEVGVICPDETALHVAVGEGAMALADGAIAAGSGSLQFVPDELLGDDPADVKAGLRSALAGLLDHDFQHLLLAHGDPIVAGGRAALARFVRG